MNLFDDTVPTATLWGSFPLDVPSGKILLLEIKVPKRKENRIFAGRMDTEEGWKDLLGKIKGEPAEMFVLEKIGIPERLGIRYGEGAWNFLKAKEWFEKRLGKSVPETEFLEKESSRDECERFPIPLETIKKYPGKWVFLKTRACG